MTRFASRIVVPVLQLVFVSFFVFALIDLAPGDAAAQIAGETASQSRIEEVRQELGLDDPLPQRYVAWLGDVVRLDFGRSLSTHEPVLDVIIRAVPPTLSLVAVSLALAVLAALIGGVVSALYPGRLVDRAITVVSALGVALPGFWLALVLVSEFAVKDQIFPAIGYVSLLDDPVEWGRHLLLPAIALAGAAGAELTRQLRGSLQDTLRSDYVLAARAKGLRQPKLVLKHALKNAAIPVITVLGVRLAQLVGGAVIVESIFNMQGLGQVTARAVVARDVPVVLGVTMFTTVVVLLTSSVVELLHPYFNPKVRKP